MKIIAKIMFNPNISFVITEDEKTKERKTYIGKTDAILKADEISYVISQDDEILPSTILTCVLLKQRLKKLEDTNNREKILEDLKNNEVCSKYFNWFSKNFGESANILDVIKWIGQLEKFINNG